MVMATETATATAALTTRSCADNDDYNKNDDCNNNKEDGNTDEKEDHDDIDDLAFVQRRLDASVVWRRLVAADDDSLSVGRTVRDVILPRWKRDLPAAAWKKVRQRFVKEYNEAEPCIRFVQKLLLVQQQDQQQQQPIAAPDPVVIVDLCSGFGILGMLLSELLPPDRVAAIWLLDRGYAMRPDHPAGPHHLSVVHIVQRSPSSTWPIPLRLRKVDLRKPREKEQLHKYIFGASKTIFTGIHLCKALSVHAINLYHAHAARTTGLALGLMLKPCCLPGKRKGNLLVDGKYPIVYTFPNYSFRPLDLYPSSKWRTNDTLQVGGTVTVPPDNDEAVPKNADHKSAAETQYHDAIVNDDGDTAHVPEETIVEPDHDEISPTVAGPKETNVVPSIEGAARSNNLVSVNDQDESSSSTVTSVDDGSCNGDDCCYHHGGGGNRGRRRNNDKTTNQRFDAWIEHLRRGCETNNCIVEVVKVRVQDHHFQNQYLLCRPTTTTTTIIT